jgi:hypothetical protein
MKENEQRRNTPNSGARVFAATYQPEFGVLRPKTLVFATSRFGRENMRYS